MILLTCFPNVYKILRGLSPFQYGVNGSFPFLALVFAFDDTMLTVFDRFMRGFNTKFLRSCLSMETLVFALRNAG